MTDRVIYSMGGISALLTIAVLVMLWRLYLAAPCKGPALVASRP